MNEIFNYVVGATFLGKLGGFLYLIDKIYHLIIEKKEVKKNETL